MNVEIYTNISCPKLKSEYRMPKILWYQTDNAIFIRIMLIDIKKYYIKVECDTFTFSTSSIDIKYFVGIKLCGIVIAEKTSHIQLGQEIKVCLIKAHKWTEWPRLHLKKIKNLLIINDPDHIFKKQWNNTYANINEKESFAEYKKRMNITNIRPPESSSSSNSESDDEKLIGYD